ncbi:hypothetical protein BU59_02655 [Escherichia coli O69:H11 str. 07-3763]|nr:hypothetical protein BU59_02655 [Escherichia coli O69:H11 str. 07-3763]
MVFSDIFRINISECFLEISARFTFALNIRRTDHIFTQEVRDLDQPFFTLFSLSNIVFRTKTACLFVKERFVAFDKLGNSYFMRCNPYRIRKIKSREQEVTRAVCLEQRDQINVIIA